MYLEEDPITQPSRIGKSSTQTAPKSSLRGKGLSENHSSTVDSAITMSEITGTSAPMMAHGVLIHQMILILTKAIRIKKQSRLLFKISTSHYFEQVSALSTVPASTLVREARGQVTVAAIVTIHNHDESL